LFDVTLVVHFYPVLLIFDNVHILVRSFKRKDDVDNQKPWTLIVSFLMPSLMRKEAMF
jgi:hypothetical protein